LVVIQGNAETGWDKFCKLLRWEKPITVASDLSFGEAIAALQIIVLPTGSWRSYIPFASNKPLVGDIVGNRGVLRRRDKWPHASCLRVLKFSVEPLPVGSVLTGTLQARLSLYLYEWVVIVFAVFMEVWEIYGMAEAKSLHYDHLFLALIRPLFFAPFLWCYVRAGLWFGRKREAELISFVQAALTRKTHIPLLAQRPSSPTEVFIRPRHRP
jgi:hypothetical protein